MCLHDALDQQPSFFPLLFIVRQGLQLNDNAISLLTFKEPPSEQRLQQASSLVELQTHNGLRLWSQKSTVGLRQSIFESRQKPNTTCFQYERLHYQTHIFT